MFTGIVEEAGRVAQVKETAEGIRLIVEARQTSEGSKIGDSIAVNGCCLTVIDVSSSASEKLLSFDLLRETWNRTNLHNTSAGSLLNLERAMASDGRIHGHFVTGHIDGTGTVEVFERRGADWYLKIKPPGELMRYLVFKGAIAVDGMSLTVAEVHADSFAIWIIPHTYAVTALKERQPGSLVNLEADLLAKYVERLVASSP